MTFNAHKIHYDHPHATTAESQPGILVHGPLTAQLLIELASREGWITDFVYRAVSPMVVDEDVSLLGWWKGSDVGQKREMEMLAVQSGKVCMKATAVIKL